MDKEVMHVVLKRVSGSVGINHQTTCIGKILETNDKQVQCMNGIRERKQEKVTASSHTTDDEAAWNSEITERAGSGRDYCSGSDLT